MDRLRKVALLGVLLMMAGCADGSGDTMNVDLDLCQNDPDKTNPGVCGCGNPDTDTDDDGILDCFDICENDPEKQFPGICGCGQPDEDTNDNGLADCLDDKIVIDLCPDSDTKDIPGICGCDAPDVDTDEDGTFDCMDQCPEDKDKISPGICGCGNADHDTDGDTIPDCIDQCKDFADKVKPGICGCEMEDSLANITDTDGDGAPDCIDLCPTNPLKTAPGSSGCDVSDTDGDGVEDPLDHCMYNPSQSAEESDCNYVTENDAQIFEIWTADDFARLRTEIETALPEFALGMPCTSMNTACYKGDQTDATYGVICTADSRSNDKKVVSLVTCPGGCVSGTCFDQGKPMPGDTTETVPATCTATETPSKLYDCCTAENFAPKCDDSATLLSCKDGMVRKQACDGACSEGACIACLQPADPAKPAEYECCEEATFHEVCDGDAVLQCVGGIIRRNTCTFGCIEQAANARHALCIPGAPIALDKPLMHIRLMRDIDLSEATDMSVHSSSLGCDAAWKPLSLYQMVFDGNNHSITFTDGKQDCDLNDAFFDVVFESDVKNLSLKYKVRGDAASVLAKYISRSRISGISVESTVRLAKAVADESFAAVYGNTGYNETKFGALASFASDSHLEQIQFAGAIATENSGTVSQIATLIGDSSAITVSGASVNLDELNCGSVTCSGAVMLSEKSKAQISGLTLEASRITSAANVIGIAGYLPDLYATRVHIAEIETTGSDKRLSALAQTGSGIAKNEISDVTIKLDKAKSAGELFSLMHSPVADIANYQVEIDKAQSGKTAAAISVFGSPNVPVSLKESAFKINHYDSEKSNFIALIDTATSANLSDITVTLGDIKANDIYTANNNSTTGSTIQKLNVSADSLDAAGDIFAMANTQTSTEIAESLLHIVKAKSGKNIYLFNKSSGSTVKYTGFELNDLTALSLIPINSSASDNLNNLALYANAKVTTPANDLITTLDKSTLRDIVSMVHQSKLAEGSENTYEPVKDHKLATLTPDTATNIWWYKQADDETAEAHSGETPTATAFDKTQVDEVLTKLSGWVKRTIAEESESVELPWPDKEPPLPEQPEPPVDEGPESGN